MRKETVTEGQNLVDLAIQHYGSVECVFDLIDDNPDTVLNLDYEAAPGDVLNIDESKIVKPDVVKYYRDRNIRLNNGQEVPTGDFNNDFNGDFDI